MIGVIVNPNARRNRGKKALRRKLEKIVGSHGRVIETPSVDAIVPALRQFADEGRRYWVADGGDGALHWMINEAIRYFGATRATEMACYLPTGGGSVDFVAHALGLPRDPRLVLSRLTAHVTRGAEPRIKPVRSLAFEGTQVLYGDQPTAFRRVGFGNALAGYGGNFFGPLYEGEKGRSPVRIAGLMATAFGAAASMSVLKGRLARVKPRFLRKAERDFLRALHAEVRIDGQVLRGSDGEPVSQHTALNCATIPLNLAGILRVFPLADGDHIHVHAGHVTGREMARVFPGLMTGRSVDHLLPDAFDGAARVLDIVCTDGDEMHPVMDGEIFYRVTELHGTLGPVFDMAVP
jgi:hypothetical protein